jgi:hypothetical protein
MVLIYNGTLKTVQVQNDMFQNCTLHITVCYKIVCFKTVKHYNTVHGTKGYSYKKVHVTKWYTVKK